jgi:hypothetical protein
LHPFMIPLLARLSISYEWMKDLALPVHVQVWH